MRKLLALLFVTAIAVPVWAADKFDPEARAKVIAPFLDNQTIGVGHVDVTRLSVERIASAIGEVGKIEAAELEKPKKETADWLAAFTKAGGKEIYVVLSTRDILAGNEPFFVIPLSEQANEEALGKLMASNPRIKHTQIGKALVIGSEATLDRVREIKPSERPDLAKAFAAAGDTTAQFLLLPSEDNRKVVEQMLPTLPKDLGGGATKPFTRGIQWSAVGLDGPPKISAKLVVQAPDAAAAKELKTAFADLAKALKENKQFQEN